MYKCEEGEIVSSTETGREGGWGRKKNGGVVGFESWVRMELN